MATKQTKAQLEIELKQALEKIAELENMQSNKKLESVLGGSEQKFRALIENSKDIITLLGADGKILYQSPSITSIMGYSPEELLGQYSGELAPADDRERNLATFQKVLNEPGVPIKTQSRYLHKNGEWRWVDITVTNLLENLDVQAIVANYRDVTEQKQLQEQLAKNETRYRNLFEEAEISLWEEDFSGAKQLCDQLKKDGVTNLREYFFSHPEMVQKTASAVKMLDVNKATLKLFEANAKEDLLLSLDKLIDPENLMAFADEMITLTNGETTFTWEGNAWTLTGKKLYVKLNLSVLAGYEDTLSRVIVSIVDMTESKNTEEKLAPSEERYRNIAEDMPAMISRFKRDGTMTFVNTFYCQYFNMQHDDLIGSNIFSWIPEEDREFVLGKFLSLNHENPYTTYEYKTHTVEGKECWQRWTDRALFNEAGEIIEFQSLGEDITERKYVEESLYKSEERFRTTFDQMLEGAQIIGFDWKYLYLNKAAETHNRRANLELIGKKYMDAWPGIESTYVFEMIKRCIEKRIPCQTENRFVYLDGLVRWFELSIQAIPEGVFILSIDITERKEAEESFKEQEFWLKESQRVGRIGSYVLDIEKDSWISSNILDDIFGIEHDADKTIASWNALVHPEEQNEMLEYFLKNVLTKHETFNKEYRIIRKQDGQIRWLWGQGELSVDENGMPFKLFGTIQDITERKLGEQNLLDSEKRYRLLFENMPIAIWEEDFSEVKNYLDLLKEKGITDFRAYFTEYPDEVVKCSALIKILDVNQSALKMYHANSKEDLIKSTDEDLNQGELGVAFESLIAIATGITSNSWKTTDVTLHEKPIEIELSWSVVPGHESDYSKVIVTTVDITDQKKAEQKLQDSKQFFQHALDALSSRIAILDETGTITAVNKNWLLFGKADGLKLADAGVGINYLETCRLAASEGIEEATAIANAIQEMLANEVLETQKAFEYPAHSEYEKRWFMAGLTKFEEYGKIRVVVSHENITERKLTEEKIKRRVLELEALYQSGISFSQTLDEKDIGEKVIEVLSGSLEWHHAGVRVRRGNSDYVELIASIHPNDDQDGGLKMQSAISRVGVGLAGWVIQHGKPLRINNLQEDSRYFKTFEGMKSGLYVPMRTYDKTIGCISAESDQLNAFTEEDEHLLITLATQAAVAIQNAELFQEIQNELTRRKLAEEKNLKQLERLTALQEIDRAITSTFDLKLSLNTLLLNTVQILEVDASTVLLIDSNQNTLDYKAGLGFITEALQTASISINQSFAGRAVREQNIIQIPNLANEPENLFRTGFFKDEGFVGYYAAPLIVKGKVIGVLEVFQRSLVQRDADWVDYFGTLAELAAIAIDNANLFSMSQHELTERRTAEEALRQSHAKLEQRVEERTADLKNANLDLEHAMRIKDEFLASMSHELRTPLNAIIGLSESLAEQVAGPLNNKQQRYIQTIGESGHHLLELINDILDLAKIEAGYMELNINSIHVEALCQSSLRMINELASKKSLQVSFVKDPAVKKINGDERRLKQSLVNLLINAVKFTRPNGKIGLEVKAIPLEHRVHFTVWDEGIGIAQEHIPLLFQSFVQLEGGLAREYSGTGLGLSLVKQMVTLHGGTVLVESEKDKGSRFTISLPWSDDGPDTERKMPKISEASPKFESRSVGNILLVEDTEQIITLLNDYLSYMGHHVTTARNGAEGVSLALKIHPDIILMDIMMPIMDGLEATRNIRKEASFKKIPIIGLTSLAMPSDRENCFKAGMSDYISKPVELKQLTNIINKHLTENGKK